MKQVERIRKMETIFDEARKTIDSLSADLEKYKGMQKDLEKLIAYYEGKQWLKDFEDDEKGKLPADLKRGVLSEDGVYNLLEDEKEMIASLLEVVRGYLKEF